MISYDAGVLITKIYAVSFVHPHLKLQNTLLAAFSSNCDENVNDTYASIRQLIEKEDYKI